MDTRSPGCHRCNKRYTDNSDSICNFTYVTVQLSCPVSASSRHTGVLTSHCGGWGEAVQQGSIISATVKVIINLMFHFSYSAVSVTESQRSVSMPTKQMQ